MRTEVAPISSAHATANSALRATGSKVGPGAAADERPLGALSGLQPERDPNQRSFDRSSLVALLRERVRPNTARSTTTPARNNTRPSATSERSGCRSVDVEW